ncbi:hypothetical protein [Pseudescherichia vulneris]|uniref:P-loop NTPase n=1 Tax=Pseudescherichia vulneris TaxID=566 RepID=UPI003017CC32
MSESNSNIINGEYLIKDILKKKKPLILFLGQDYASYNEEDQVLDKLNSHLDIQDKKKEGWLNVIKSQKLSSEKYEWLSERFERTARHDSIDNIFQISWSAIFTTSIDPQISKKLESRGRAPETILSKDHFARVARSRSRPPVYYLFGKSNELENNYSVPTNIIELLQRKNIHTNVLMGRISETVTSLGLLVIDGFNENRDWLPIDDVLSLLSVNPDVAILWLGKAPTDSMFFDLMKSSGQITYDNRPLSEIIVSMLVNSDSLSDEQLGVIEQIGTDTITLNDGKYFKVPSSLRLRVESTANIIDDSWLEQLPLLTGVELEEDFRRFHGGFGGIRNQFEGIRKGYAVKRLFENTLENNCIHNLRNFGKAVGYIVVHGQSGTGKSVALARMAYALRSEFKLPILYAKNRIPTASDIEDFIAEAERCGALCVVVVCDANQPPDKYRDLANSLKSRGRKCLVLGTAYKIEGIKKDNKNFIEADSRTTDQEVKDLSSLLHRFAPSLIKSLTFNHNEKNIFSLLYRHLTMGRSRIIDGIADEARYTEQVVRIKARNIPYSNKPQYVLAKQLIELGIGNSTIALFEDEVKEHTEAGIDAAGKLIDLVMVAGRLDCPVPLNLLLRALSGTQNSLDYVQIAYLFEELDLFRWDVADAEGHEYFVQPRLRLEAELICRRRLSERTKEIECLLQLIKSVRHSGTDRKSEISFLLDLLVKMQKEGPRKNAYQDGYLDVANVLTKLRNQHNVVDASLMLQESVFRRAAVYASDKKDNFDIKALTVEHRDLVLNEAREIVEFARSQIAERKLRASKKTQQSLAVEHASIYGYLAVGLARQDVSEAIVWSHYLAAKTAINTAISVANNHYPFDIALWTPVDILKYKEFSLAHKMELTADILSIFDQADTVSFSAFSATKFEGRKLRTAMDLGFDKIEEETYLSLEQTNPSVAYYIKARSICSKIFKESSDTVPEHLIDCVSESVSFLKNKLDVVLTDIRPLQLLIQLLWIEKTRSFIFKREKVAIPQDKQFQDEILLLVRNLNHLAGENKRNNFRLLEAVFEWVRGSAEHARELFNELSSDTEFEDFTRVTRRFILEGDESEKGYKGRVVRDRGDGHWTISVFDLSQDIDLLGRDFIGDDIAVGREISRFNIAFNYLGPIADPLSRYGARS